MDKTKTRVARFSVDSHVSIGRVAKQLIPLTRVRALHIRGRDLAQRRGQQSNGSGQNTTDCRWDNVGREDRHVAPARRAIRSGSWARNIRSELHSGGSASGRPARRHRCRRGVASRVWSQRRRTSHCLRPPATERAITTFPRGVRLARVSRAGGEGPAPAALCEVGTPRPR